MGWDHPEGVPPVGRTIEIADVDRTAVPRVLATTWDSRTFDAHWSPDGSQLSYVLPRGLYVVDSAGRQSECVGDGGDPSGRVLPSVRLRHKGGPAGPPFFISRP